jgi:hypothetical protein
MHQNLTHLSLLNLFYDQKGVLLERLCLLSELCMQSLVFLFRQSGPDVPHKPATSAGPGQPPHVFKRFLY